MKTFPALPISQRLGTGLARLGLALKTKTWRVAQPFGLSATQAQVLALLYNSPQGLTLNELASRLGVRPPTASQVVAGLARKKLVDRRPHPVDARSVLIQLTPAGRQLAARLRGWPDFLAQAIDQLSEPEQAVLLSALIKIIRHLQNRGEIPVARMCVNCIYFRPNAYRDPLRPHHCDFVDAPFGEKDFMLDCPDFQPALILATQREETS